MSTIIIRGEDIRRARKARGMTQAALAKLVGRSTGLVSQWEKGITEVGPEAARRLAAWLAQTPEPTAAKDSTPATLTIPFPAKFADIANELGVNLANLFATKGIDAIHEELTRLWQKHHAEAIAQHNAYIEEHGIPLADVRAW